MSEPAAPQPLRARYEVAVLGAGISGLVLSYLLQRAGKEVVLLEADSRIGGVIRSERQGAMLLERGPNTLFVDDTVRRLLNVLELEEALIPLAGNAKKRYLCTAHSPALTPAPQNLIQAINSPLLSRRGKLRVLAEPLYARRWRDDVSVQEFISRHFGVEFAHELMATALIGVWAGDISQLSAECCLPKLWQLAHQHRSIVFGAFRGGARQHRMIASFPGGLSQLCEEIAARCSPQSIHLQRRIEGLKLDADSVRLYGESFELQASQVFLCTPAAATAQLLQPLNAALAAAIASIPHQSLAISQLSFERESCRHPLDGVGYLAASSLRRRLLGSLFFSSMFPAHSPSGRALLSVFSGGAHASPEPELTDESLEELRKLLGITSVIERHGGTLWHKAIPNYAPGHHRIQTEVADFENDSRRLKLLGNWLDGISIPDRIRAAQLAAADYLNRLP